MHEYAHIRHLLAHVPHVALATVNDDGTPHNTPVRGVFNDVLHMFWASSPEAQHSKTIVRDGKVFAVVFNSAEGGGGLYMAGQAQVIEDGSQFDYAYALLKHERADMDSMERYRGNGPQRMYRFVPEKFWVHRAVKDEDGYFITDERVPVTLADIAPGSM